MPPIKTAPGAATDFSPRISDELARCVVEPTTAAYSATFKLFEDVTTPIPPRTAEVCPAGWSKMGTPPGFTAFGLLSYTSALPVRMPGPGPPLSAVDGGSRVWNATVFTSVQPRLVFSMPYRSALG